MPDQPFTKVELEIAALAGKGYGHRMIARSLKRQPDGIRQTIKAMALKLPNPDDLPPLTLVQLWGAHRRWLDQQPNPPTHSAA